MTKLLDLFRKWFRTDHGDTKWELWTGKKTVLRGANIWQEIIDQGLEPQYEQADFKKLKDWGANFVNFSVPGLYSVTKDKEDEERRYCLLGFALNRLKQMVEMAAKEQLYVVLCARTGPGRDERGFDDEESKKFPNPMDLHKVWADEAAQNAWIDMWGLTASNFKHYQNVIGYNLMVEPNANDVWFRKQGESVGMYSTKDATTIDQFMAICEQNDHKLKNWNHLANRITKEIREIDKETPIIISTMDWGNPAWLRVAVPPKQERIIYSVHCYDPYDYSSDPRLLNDVSYPKQMPIDNSNPMINKVWLKSQLECVVDFRKKHHNIPVVVDEFGPIRWKLGAETYFRDYAELFEEMGINHCLWIWQPEKIPKSYMSNWNFKLGTEKNNPTPTGFSAMIEEIKRIWGKNRQ